MIRNRVAGSGLRLRRSCCRPSSTVAPSASDSNQNGKSQQFTKAKVGEFVQCEPWHENSFTSDSFLQSYLRRVVPGHILDTISPDLNNFGHRCATDIQVLGRECEVNPPQLIQTSAWGERVDILQTCPAWKQLKAISAEEGLIATAYERENDNYSRLHQMVKLFMFSPVSGLYSCPLAMTDGAAKTIETLNIEMTEAYDHLTSRDPERFWTSGQWMTEKRGGSDVSGATETVALHQQDDLYTLHGYKWFSSATDSDISFTLARTEGSSKLSMFYLKTRTDSGRLNNIQVYKLKNKLGTRQLPTAELLLDGTKSRLVSQEGRGIAAISNMLTVTRIHNSVSAAASMRKITSLARDFATRRTAFGSQIYKHPLHVQTLARMEVETRGCCALTFDLAFKLGQEDCKTISDQDLLLLRLLTPVSKFYTAKASVAVVSEGLECFGGQGYIEDTGLPGLLRDVQVLPIWEGTSSVMSLDVVRALQKTGGEALVALQSRVETIVKSSPPALVHTATGISQAMSNILKTIHSNPDKIQANARDLCLSIAHTYIAALLLEHASHTNADSDKFVVEEWCKRDLCPLAKFVTPNLEETQARERSLVYELYDEEKNFRSKFIR